MSSKNHMMMIINKAWALLQFVLHCRQNVRHRFVHRFCAVELVLKRRPNSNHRTKGNKAKCITNQRQPLHISYCAYKGPQLVGNWLGRLPKQIECLVAIPDRQGEYHMSISELVDCKYSFSAGVNKKASK